MIGDERGCGRRFLIFADLAADDWAVMRERLPADAGVPLLLAARDAADRVLLRIIKAARRAGLSEEAAWLLDCACASVVGRIAQLDDWHRQRAGLASTRRPYGEDTGYASAMRMAPERLARVIAAVNGAPSP